jgi:hypothetical protein
MSAMASEAAIQKRELAVLGKIQTELAFFVDRQTMQFDRDNSVPKEFDFDNFEIIDNTPPRTRNEQWRQTEQCAQSMPAAAAEEGPENLEWFAKLLSTASSAA